MVWTASILLGLACWLFARNHPHDVDRALWWVLVWVFALATLIAAPPLVKGVFLLGAVALPLCNPNVERSPHPSCPPLCVLRGRCRRS